MGRHYRKLLKLMKILFFFIIIDEIRVNEIFKNEHLLLGRLVKIYDL